MLGLVEGDVPRKEPRLVAATPQAFLAMVKAFREDLVVAVECMFTWYWLADLCAKEGIAFVLGHALYMRAIHGGKAKNDRIDAHKIAALLRGGMIPMAYVYPHEMRATRDLMRCRNHLVRKRSELIAHIQNTASQYNLPPFARVQDFLSYCRLVKPKRESAGKLYGHSGRKIGNAHRSGPSGNWPPRSCVPTPGPSSCTSGSRKSTAR